MPLGQIAVFAENAPAGPGSGFVRGQRYTSLAALKQQPQTTAERLRYQRQN